MRGDYIAGFQSDEAIRRSEHSEKPILIEIAEVAELEPVVLGEGVLAFAVLVQVADERASAPTADL